jgi:hypothetical protein
MAGGISTGAPGIESGKRTQEETSVKPILASTLVLALGIAGLSLLGAAHDRPMAASSSQILIHGTPVCVIQQGGEIRAAVGLCGAPAVGPENGCGPGKGSDVEASPGIGTRRALPPGHPPVDFPPTFGEGRRILI